jgi:hypothetical protein
MNVWYGLHVRRIPIRLQGMVFQVQIGAREAGPSSYFEG